MAPKAKPAKKTVKAKAKSKAVKLSVEEEGCQKYVRRLASESRCEIQADQVETGAPCPL